MIPKIIHYCWFGGNPLPKMALKCIASWKKFFPGWEIKEWNESNFDVHAIPYIAEAYGAKKYAFVSDYARFKILHDYGGVYFDTDVEVIAPMADIILKGNFMGCEKEYKPDASPQNLCVAPGLGMGAEAGLDFYNKILDFYKSIHFMLPNGKLNQETVVSYTTKLLCQSGLQNTNSVQCIENINIYPKEYFCPIDYDDQSVKMTENTRSIHHYASSWMNKEDIRTFELKRKLYFLPNKIGWKFARLFAILHF